MKQYAEIEYRDLEPKEEYNELVNKVVAKCFEVEKLENANLYISVILTTPEVIREFNKEYRNVDRATDVLSFPMFEKEEIQSLVMLGEFSKSENKEVLGDIIISVEKVQEQAKEFEHSFDRELAYMVVHGFYHLMGEDHMQDEEKKHMRGKEENVLKKLKINRENV